MSNVFVIDVARCSGCHNCQLACKDEHVGNDWAPYAKPQPQIGQFWIKVQENVCGSIPKVKINFKPLLCNHCKNATCMSACPVDAIYRREDGLVLIDPEKCTGCRACESACPYEAIFFNEELAIAQKCTGCAHLLDNGAKLPRCADACPTGAIRFGDEKDLKDEIAGAAVLQPELGLMPRVYYRNIPGKFIAGTVYDPVEKDVIEGARCHLSAGPRVWDVMADDFGDFWFKDLPVGTFDLTITAPGFLQKTFAGLRTDKDLNLGDIAMER